MCGFKKNRFLLFFFLLSSFFIYIWLYVSFKMLNIKLLLAIKITIFINPGGKGFPREEGIGRTHVDAHPVQDLVPILYERQGKGGNSCKE